MVLIDHDLELVMGVCDEVVVLDQGRLLASGPPEVVRRDPAVRAAYIGGTDDKATAGTPRKAARVAPTAGPIAQGVS
jgi:energy-coupling factor transporter ATP-binding protein EcfA2